MTKCRICGEEITAENKYWLRDGFVFCVVHEHIEFTNSQAGDEAEQRVAASTAQKEQGNG